MPSTSKKSAQASNSGARGRRTYWFYGRAEDLPTNVGEEPLPQSDDSDVDDQIEAEGKDQTTSKKDKNINLSQLAENALPFVRPVLNKSPA